MSDEFGTVSSNRGDRAREIARLREHYRNHRETLSGLMGDAPSDQLATEYERLVQKIDSAVKKLDELEGTATLTNSPLPVDTNPMLRPKTRPGATAPGNRPLLRTEEPSAVAGANPRSVVVMIVAAGLIVLAAIAYLIWRPRTAPKIVEQPVPEASQTTLTQPPAITPVIPESTLKITPALADYGTIRKGTRAVRQFEVTNGSASPIDLQVARSGCRCLYYDYKSKLGANAKETITVTIDGARAKAGPLEEQVNVTTKGDSSMSATFMIRATIR